MRILVTGVSGMLGSAVFERFKSQGYEVYGTGNSNFINQPAKYLKFDLKSNSYEELLNWSKPELIVHCAALTNGNYCKKNPLEALEVNGITVSKLLESTSQNVKIIYISTDAVFPSRLSMAKETDCTAPENIYGRSKDLGEFFLFNSERKFLIIRTTIVGVNLNSKKESFVEWIINSVKKNDIITLFEDVKFNPITIWDLSDELIFLIQNNNVCSEILHICGDEVTTKYNFGIDLITNIDLPTVHIKKGSIESFADRAKRCADQTMDNNYYKLKYSRTLPNIRDTISSLKKHIL